MTGPPRRQRDPAPWLWGATGTTCLAATGTTCLALLAAPALAGAGRPLHHGISAAPVEGTAPSAFTVGGGAASVLTMAAMMLPGAAPALRTPCGAGAREPRRAGARVAVLSAYLGAWMGFGALGLAGQAAVHAVVARWAWLNQRPALVTAAALAVAGLYQCLALTGLAGPHSSHQA